jgi:DNA polymerase-3 subunit gamma/tau
LKISYKYKPKDFDSVISQKYVCDYFQSLIKNPTRYPNAYLFYGERGIGKSTVANVFSDSFPGAIKKFYSINTFNNIDSFKDINSNINNMYKFSKNKYVLIFDEFHRASSQAQQVLLDVLEDETIKNIYYIFTTTEYDKILDTIISRTLPFYFMKLTDDEILNSLNFVLEKENIKMSDEDKNLIIYKSDGHLREAYAYLDLYILEPVNFKDLVVNTSKLLKDFLISKIDNVKEIRRYAVSILMKDLDKFIERYVYDNINNIMKTIKVLEIYSKFKNEINTIDHFVAVLNVMKKIINE